MVIKFWAFKDKIFVAAILVSLLWHLFWVSAIKIVFAPAAQRMKFSKVSFLGPIPKRGVLAARALSRERSFLEKRYLEQFGYRRIGEETLEMDMAHANESVARKGDKTVTVFIEDIFAASKLEPPH